MYLKVQNTNRAAFFVLLFISSVLFSSPVLSNSVEEGLHAFKLGDKELAYQNWLPLAIKGDVRAQFFLSVLYEQWTGGENDASNAKRWLTAAANNGFIPAQFNLGNNYHLGKYGRANNKMAALWWEQAAAQGFAEAQYLLGTIYYWGEGIELDLKESIYWLDKAANSGLKKARTAVLQARAGTLGRDNTIPENIAYDDPRIVLGTPAAKGVGKGPSVIREQVVVKPGKVETPTTESIDSKATLGVKGSDKPLKDVPVKTTVDEKGTEATQDSPQNQELSWVQQQPADNYTIQLFASVGMRHCEKHVTQLKQSYRLEVHAYPFVMQRKNMCAVIYGSFPSRSAAMARLQKLPGKIRQAKPWLRKLGGLQRMAR